MRACASLMKPSNMRSTPMLLLQDVVHPIPSMPLPIIKAFSASMKHEPSSYPHVRTATACVDVKPQGTSVMLSYRPTASHRHALLCAGDRVQPCQPAAIRTLDVIPKSLRGVQSSEAEPSEAPRAVAPDQGQLSGDSSEWEVRVRPATQSPAFTYDRVP